MRPIFFAIFSLLSTEINAQVIKLNEIEKKIITSKNQDYHKFLERKGFELMESKKEGTNGVYENWIFNNKNLHLTVQNNDGIGFTKVTLSEGIEANDSAVESMISDINREYSNKTINNHSYYIKEDNPETTIHLIKLRREGKSVDGVLFFHKH